MSKIRAVAQAQNKESVRRHGQLVSIRDPNDTEAIVKAWQNLHLLERLGIIDNFYPKFLWGRPTRVRASHELPAARLRRLAHGAKQAYDHNTAKALACGLDPRNVTIYIGSANMGAGGALKRAFGGPPIRRLVRLLRRLGFNVVLVQEPGTSQNCLPCTAEYQPAIGRWPLPLHRDWDKNLERLMVDPVMKGAAERAKRAKARQQTHLDAELQYRFLPHHIPSPVLQPTKLPVPVADLAPLAFYNGWFGKRHPQMGCTHPTFMRDTAAAGLISLRGVGEALTAELAAAQVPVDWDKAFAPPLMKYKTKKKM